jgi:hypothetical protein
MATYDPPQPMWKRNLAGILDFFLTFFCLRKRGSKNIRQSIRYDRRSWQTIHILRQR